MRVVIVGGGLTGTSIALSLAGAGHRVELLERGAFGVESASAAAAGMLAPGLERHASAAMQALCVASRGRFSGFLAEVRERAGIDVPLRSCGSLRVAFDAEEAGRLTDDVARQRARGFEAAWLEADAARAREPQLDSGVVGAALHAGDAVVEPRHALRAARVAAAQAGAVLRDGVSVVGLHERQTRVAGVRLEGGEIIEADHVVLATGSWATTLQGTGMRAEAVRPVRGQMIELHRPVPDLRGIVEGAGAYLAPRRDGRLLVGSTMEHVGFERAVTAGAVASLLGAAIAVVPALEDARFVDSWCGFRAGTPDGHPLIGPAPRDGLWLATGHFRNGVLLAPITAALVRAALEEGEPPADVPAATRQAIDPRRFAA